MAAPDLIPFNVRTDQGTYRVQAPQGSTPEDWARLIDAGQGQLIEPPPLPASVASSPLDWRLFGVSPRSLGRVAVENLPMIGGAAGGILGMAPAAVAGPLGLATAPVGAGVGYAAGSRLRDIIQRRPLPSVPEMVMEFASGAAGEAGGQVVIKPIAKGVEWASRMVLPFVKGAASSAGQTFKRTAEEFGVLPSASELAGSPTLAKLEAMTTGAPFGAGTMRKMTDVQLASQKKAAEGFAFPPGEAPDPSVVGGVVQETARRPAQTAITETENLLRRQFPPPAPSPAATGQGIQETVRTQRETAEQASEAARRLATERFGFQGSRPTPTQVGTGAQEAATAAEAAVRTQASPLYRRVEELVGPGPIIPSTNLAEVSSSVVQREFAVRGVQKTPLARTAAGLEDTTAATPQRRLTFGGDPVSLQDLPADVIEQLGLDQSRTLTFQAARDIQSRLVELVRTTRDRFARAQFAALHTAVSRDIEAFGEATGGEVNVALKAANDFFRERVARVFINDEAGRRTFVATLGRTKPELVVDTIRTAGDVRNLRAALGTGTPEMAQVEQAYMQRLIDQATDPVTQQINPVAFVKAVTKKGGEFFGALLGPQGAAQLQQTMVQFRAGRVPDSAFLAAVGKLSPEKVVGQVRTITDVQDLMRTLGPTSPRMEEVRHGVMRPIIEAATDPATGQVSPTLFAEGLRKQGSEFLEALLGRRRARELFVAAEQMARTNTPTTPFLKALAGAKPESVVGMVKTVSDAGSLMQALGPASREAELVRRSFMQQAIDKASQFPTGVFHPQTFVEQMIRYTPEFRRALFGPETGAALDRFVSVLQRQIEFSGSRFTGQKGGASLLGAGQVYGGGVGMLTGLLTGSPRLMLASGLALGAPPTMAWVLTSPRGIRLLTQGIVTGPGTPHAARITAQLAALAADQQRDEPPPPSDAR